MRILLFLRENICHNSINYWILRIAQQLEKYGAETVFVATSSDASKMNDQFKDVLNKPIHAAIAVNAVGQQNYSNGSDNLWDVLGIPFINYIVDHPVLHDVDLESTCKNYHVICLAPEHVDYINRYYKNVKSSHFFPLAGVDGSYMKKDTIDEFIERPFDVVFSGGCFPYEDIERDIMKYPDGIRKLNIDYIEYMKANQDLKATDALKTMLRKDYNMDEISDENLKKFAKVTVKSIIYMNRYIRQSIIQKILSAGIELHIFGDGWTFLKEGKYDSAIFHQEIDMAQIGEVYKNAKLAINISPVTGLSIHDRIITAQLNGASVITDMSSYIGDVYSVNGSEGTAKNIYVYKYSDIDSLPNKIQRIMNDPFKLYATAKQGWETAKTDLSWDATGQRLFGIVSEICRAYL